MLNHLTRQILSKRFETLAFAKVSGINSVNSFRPRDFSRPITSSQLPSSATLLQNDNVATVVLLGTVHFSKQSIEDVSSIVKVLNPNAIFLELCRQRIPLLELDEKKFLEDIKKFNSAKTQESIKETMKRQGVVSGVMHAMYLKTSSDIAKKLGVAPGGEFRRAFQEMKKIPGCKLFLGDRPIQITVARASKALSMAEMAQLLFQSSKAKRMKIDSVSLEKFKDKDFVQEQLLKKTEEIPALKKIYHVFIDERDKCLAYSLQECVRIVEKPRVLAVVGMGHVEGIVKYYGKMRQEDIVPLLVIPREPIYRSALRTGIKLTFYFLVFSFFYKLFIG